MVSTQQLHEYEDISIIQVYVMTGPGPLIFLLGSWILILFAAGVHTVYEVSQRRLFFPAQEFLVMVPFMDLEVVFEPQVQHEEEPQEVAANTTLAIAEPWIATLEAQHDNIDMLPMICWD